MAPVPFTAPVISIGVAFVPDAPGLSVRTFEPRLTGPDRTILFPDKLAVDAVFRVAFAESVVVPDNVAVWLPTANDPLIAPWLTPAITTPSPPMVKLLATVELLRISTEPLPLTNTFPVPNALLLVSPVFVIELPNAFCTRTPVTYVLPE